MAKNPEGDCVLIVRFSALGDVALTVPAVYSVCRQYPDTRFVMITRPGAAQLFVNPPENLTLEPVDTSHCRGVRRIARLAASLYNRYHPVAMIDLHDVIRSKILRGVLRLHGVKIAVIHKGRAAKRALTRPKAKRMVQLKPTFKRYTDTFARAGYPADDDFASVYPNLRPAEDAQLIAVAPFARHKGKEYPLPLMESVLGLINERLPEAQIILFGDMSNPREWKQMTAWEAKFPHVSLKGAGESLGRQLEILAGCSAMLSMDSANMHLASLVGVPAVSVWGATHPFCGFLGYGQKMENTVQLDMVCRPCSVFGNKPCRRGDWHCMRAIQPEMVAAAVEKVVKQRQDRTDSA